MRDEQDHSSHPVFQQRGVCVAEQSKKQSKTICGSVWKGFCPGPSMLTCRRRLKCQRGGGHTASKPAAEPVVSTNNNSIVDREGHWLRAMLELRCNLVWLQTLWLGFVDCWCWATPRKLFGQACTCSRT